MYFLFFQWLRQEFVTFTTRLVPPRAAQVTNFFMPETGPVHPFFDTTIRGAVSRYKIPNAGIRRLLLRNGNDLWAQVIGGRCGAAALASGLNAGS